MLVILSCLLCVPVAVPCGSVVKKSSNKKLFIMPFNTQKKNLNIIASSGTLLHRGKSQLDSLFF